MSEAFSRISVSAVTSKEGSRLFLTVIYRGKYLGEYGVEQEKKKEYSRKKKETKNERKKVMIRRDCPSSTRKKERDSKEEREQEETFLGGRIWGVCTPPHPGVSYAYPYRAHPLLLPLLPSFPYFDGEDFFL